MQKINSKQFIFLILGTSIVSQKTYPNILIAYGKRDSWIAVTIASVIAILYYMYIIKVSLKAESYNLYDIYTTALGKSFGDIFYLLFIATMFLTMVESASITANSMHQSMILETPTWFILLFFVATSAYSVKKGLRALIITVIISITLIMIAGTNLGILSMPYRDNKYLYPILQYGFNKDMFITILLALGLYGGLAVTLPYINNVSDKRRLFKCSLIALLIVTQMEIYSIIGVVTTFGYKRALNIYYPKLLQTQLVTLFDFLEGESLLVILQILGGWYLKYITVFYGLLKLLEIFNKKPKKYAIWVITILVFILSYFVSKDSFLLKELLYYYTYIALINFIIIPFIVFGVFSMKYSKSKTATADNSSISANTNSSNTNDNSSDNSYNNNNNNNSNDNNDDNVSNKFVSTLSNNDSKTENTNDKNKPSIFKKKQKKNTQE